MVVLGHNNILNFDTMDKIKKNYNSKFLLWYEDALGYRGEGPNWKKNLKLIEKNNDLIDAYYITTHPDEVKSKINKSKLNYLPIPVDENIENLNIYNYKNRFKDLFFALSHGVNYGKLKTGKKDERESFITNLLNKYPNINYNILGISDENPKWNYKFYEELVKCKMALNLSRGKPVKYTSSNRIAALIGNGIFTFVDIKTKFNDFFNSEEIGFYKDFDEVENKIEYFLRNPSKINKFARNGKLKYFKLFNNIKLTKDIVEKIF